MEVILGIFVNLITDPIDKYVVTPIKRHVSYAFTCDSNVHRLQDDVEKLQNRRVRLQKSVAVATRKGKKIHANVTEWLDTAKKKLIQGKLIQGKQEAEKLIQGKQEAKNKCFVGFCTNLKTRYQLSKKADKKVSEIDMLHNADGLDSIAFTPSPQPIIEPSLYSREGLPSRMLLVEQIIDCLKDPKMSIIGVYGMGGIGKTTLAKEIQQKAVEKKLFKTVVVVAVSETPDVRRIQGEIADSLGLELTAEQVTGRASQLHQRLKEVKVLIILDDVWQELDLSNVGIPSGDASEGCKIFVTSRKKDVLSKEMRTQKEFPLNVLEEEEAWKLFEMSVSNGVDPELQAIATEVAKKCAGLPLLILKVATDLQNKAPYAWNDMLNKLSRNKKIYEKVHTIIESSYEKLPDEDVKSLFLLCAQFGNSNIRIHDLFIYCVGLALFEDIDSLEGARNRVLTTIDTLKDECLLSDGNKAGFVKMHDVVREVTLAISVKVQHTFVGTSEVRSTDLRSKDCTRMSLPYCDMLELPEVLECPEVELFSMFADDRYLDLHDSFFEGVAKLKILHFSQVTSRRGLPSSLGVLTGLQALYLHKCSFRDVAMIAELKQLELLSFADSDKLYELPSEIKVLTRLKLLDLRGCSKLAVIPANVISNLCFLEELYMLKSFDRWDERGQASLVELKNLSRLAILEIQVKDDKFLPDDWFFNGVRNYRISIGKWSWSDNTNDYEISRKLKLELRTSIDLVHRVKEFMSGTEVLHISKVNGVENLFSDSGLKAMDYGQLRILKILDCDTLKNLFPVPGAKCFPKLQELELKFCYNMEALFGEASDDEMIEFTQLTALKLSYLPDLTSFCRTSGMVSVPNLTSLDLYKCSSLKYVFTTSMVKSLQQLKNVKIEKCELLEEIILSKKFEEIEAESFNTIVFPELDYLEFKELPNLKRFSSRYPIEFPKLRELRMHNCRLENFVSKFSDKSNNDESIHDETLFNELVSFSNLKILYIRELHQVRYLWHKKFADDNSFSEVKSLTVECLGIFVVFPSNAYRRFRRLESLSVSFCNQVEQIYEYEESGFEENDIVPPFALQEVLLHMLPTLRHIWSKDMDGVFSFQNLQRLSVRFCEDLKYVFPTSIACGLLQLEDLHLKKCGLQMIIAELKNEGSEGRITTRTFKWSRLKYLEVYGCDKLIKFGSIISETIPNVEGLRLDHHFLKPIQSDEFGAELLWKLDEVYTVDLDEESAPFLFGFLSQRIHSLEKLFFQKGSLGEIFSLDDKSSIEEERQYSHLRLKHVELICLRNLKHIVKKDSQLNPILQCLQILIVAACNDMINIAPSSASFGYLTTLEVESCTKMTSLVTASTAKSMIQLTKLRVYNCEMIEEIVTKDDQDWPEQHGVIFFEKLKHLNLSELHRLNSFCSGNYMLNFPMLEQVVLTGCDQMKIFCGGVLSTPKLNY